MSDGRVMGVDEAEKGPVIGPLVTCGVVFSAGGLETLSERGVRDSKKLSPEQRERLADPIKRVTEAYEIMELEPRTTDDARAASPPCLKLCLSRICP